MALLEALVWHVPTLFQWWRCPPNILLYSVLPFPKRKRTLGAGRGPYTLSLCRGSGSLRLYSPEAAGLVDCVDKWSLRLLKFRLYFFKHRYDACDESLTSLRNGILVCVYRPNSRSERRPHPFSDSFWKMLSQKFA